MIVSLVTLTCETFGDSYIVNLTLMTNGPKKHAEDCVVPAWCKLYS